MVFSWDRHTVANTPPVPALRQQKCQVPHNTKQFSPPEPNSMDKHMH